MRYIKAFFIGLGVVFFILILTITYLLIADPFNVRPLISLVWSHNNATVEPLVTTPADATAEDGIDPSQPTPPPAPTTTETSNALPLSPAQTAALETVGVDPADIPTSISPEQEACFIELLGQERVDAIKAGAAPTPLEIWQARECL